VDYLKVQHITIHGDYQEISNYVLGSSHISHPHLELQLIKCLWDSLQGVTYQHLHRAHNKVVDALSKLGLLDPLEGFYISLGQMETCWVLVTCHFLDTDFSAFLLLLIIILVFTYEIFGNMFFSWSLLWTIIDNKLYLYLCFRLCFTLMLT